MPLIKLNATQGLTGTLPAVSGANLTGISADYVHIKTQTVTSGVASVNFVNGTSGVVFDGTYKRYMVFVQDLITADDNSAQTRVRISSNGGSSYFTSGYLSSGYRAYGKDSGGGDDRQFQNNSFDCININAKTSLSGGGINGVFYLTDPTVNRDQQFWSDFGAHDNEWSIRQMSSGVYTTQTTINAFQIVCLTSNIAGGVFTLYGLKSS
tara:strand:+ start:14 stop:640 length:627 start_codon:yes stop_codon:yes gene_type:complete